MKVNYKLGQRKFSYTPPSYIDSIYIYGSYITGYQRPDSDMDHLIVIDDGYRNSKEEIEYKISRLLGVPLLWVSVYTKSEIKRRCMRGDYFFWSIKLHHKKVYDKSGFLDDVFYNMPVFKEVTKSLLGGQEYLEEVMENYKHKRISKTFVKIKLFYIFRCLYINMLFLKGEIEFDKFRSIDRCMVLYKDLPIKKKSYTNLLRRNTRLTDQDVRQMYKDYRVIVNHLLILINQLNREGFENPLRKHLH